MLLIALSYRRCARNLRAKLDTVINPLAAYHAYLKTLYRFHLDKKTLRETQTRKQTPSFHSCQYLSPTFNLTPTPLGLCLPMFIIATTRQQISIYSIGPYCYLLACTPHIWKSGVQNFFRSRNPHLKIHGAAHGYNPHRKVSANIHNSLFS